jgi:hypothetical protein
MTTFLPPKLCTHHGGLKGLLIHPASTHATTQPSHFQIKSYIFCTRAMSSSTDCFWFTKKRTGRLFLTRHGKVLDSDRSLTTFNYTLQYFPRLKWGGFCRWGASDTHHTPEENGITPLWLHTDASFHLTTTATLLISNLQDSECSYKKSRSEANRNYSHVRLLFH